MDLAPMGGETEEDLKEPLLWGMKGVISSFASLFCWTLADDLDERFS